MPWDKKIDSGPMLQEAYKYIGSCKLKSPFSNSCPSLLVSHRRLFWVGKDKAAAVFASTDQPRRGATADRALFSSQGLCFRAVGFSVSFPFMVFA
ncbi:hypothetical protein GQ457_04G005110 [Hibiscus cannabinus]